MKKQEYNNKYRSRRMIKSVNLFQMASCESTNDEEKFDTFQNIMRHIISIKNPPIPMLLLRHPPVRTSVEASSQRQVPLHSGAKAMLVSQKNSDKYTLIVLPAHLNCDNKKIASFLGIANSRLRMANEDEVRRITGCIPGAVPPYGALFPQPVQTLIDSKMAHFTAHPPPLSLNPQVTLFSTSDPEWPTDLAGQQVEQFNNHERTDCINFNIGLRTISCSIAYDDYLRVLGVDNYFICDISK